jgi:hypothetical protein
VQPSRSCTLEKIRIARIKGGLRDQRGQYLIPRRSETRGIVSIGFLAVALIAGGSPATYHFGLLSNEAHTTHLEAAEAVPPLPILTPAAAIQAEPIVTPVAAYQVQPIVTAVSPVFRGVVTHYGVSYNGSPMGCDGTLYTSENPTIIAVGPALDYDWPCGTQLRICGPVDCMVGMRQDSCPGCTAYVLDLSEAGINLVCGDQAEVCRVGIEEVTIEYPPPPPPPPPIEVIQLAPRPGEAPILRDLGIAETPDPAPAAGLDPVP